MNPSITLRTVPHFPEPEFTGLVAQLLHDPDRREVAARWLDAGITPVPSTAQQVRIGAYDGETLVGWSHGMLAQTSSFYVATSAVLPAFRRQGVYTRLVAAMEEQARQLGCLRIESHHRAANSAVLIAKMKAGYLIVGTEFTGEMGLLVKLCKPLTPRREALLQARAGMLEGAVRFFHTDPP